VVRSWHGHASAVLRDSAIAAVPAQFAVIQVAAPSLGVVLRPVDVRNVEEIDAPLRLSRRVRQTPARSRPIHCALTITLAARHLVVIFWSSTPLTAAGSELSQ